MFEAVDPIGYKRHDMWDGRNAYPGPYLWIPKDTQGSTKVVPTFPEQVFFFFFALMWRA